MQKRRKKKSPEAVLAPENEMERDKKEKEILTFFLRLEKDEE